MATPVEFPYISILTFLPCIFYSSKSPLSFSLTYSSTLPSSCTHCLYFTYLHFVFTFWHSFCGQNILGYDFVTKNRFLFVHVNYAIVNHDTGKSWLAWSLIEEKATWLCMICNYFHLSPCSVHIHWTLSSGRQEHSAHAMFNHTEDFVMFPDEATTSLCAWDARNAQRKNLLSLGKFP